MRLRHSWQSSCKYVNSWNISQTDRNTQNKVENENFRCYFFGTGENFEMRKLIYNFFFEIERMLYLEKFFIDDFFISKFRDGRKPKKKVCFRGRYLRDETSELVRFFLNQFYFIRKKQCMQPFWSNYSHGGVRRKEKMV